MKSSIMSTCGLVLGQMTSQAMERSVLHVTDMAYAKGMIAGWLYWLKYSGF